MKLKLAETFVSIQGEGHLTGKPMFFIRFAGCNVRSCNLHPSNLDLCDTDWSMKALLDHEDHIEQLAVQARDLMGHQGWVSITGGEPTDQMDALCFLVNELRRRGLQVNIQTSGTRLLPCPWDWLTVSPKCSVAGLEQRFGNELKLVYQGQDAGELRSWQRQTKFWNYYLMPLHRDGHPNTQETVDAVLNVTGWELTTQAHKVWKVS
jgi:7-carboxy-7-deazaguanine synthase